MVTNLLGTADEAEQRRVIRGLRRFGDVVVDLQRFFVRRTGTGEIESLVAMFRDEGFPAPEPAFSGGPDGEYVRFGTARLGSLVSRQNWHIRADRLRARLAANGARRKA